MLLKTVLFVGVKSKCLKKKVYDRVKWKIRVVQCLSAVMHANEENLFGPSSMMLQFL